MYIITTPLDPSAPINLRRLAFYATFPTIQAARDFLAAAPSPDASIDLTIHRWLGETVDGVPFFRDEPLSLAATLLPLPSPGGGCRDEHRPLLDYLTSFIGHGLPLDALIGGAEDDDETIERWEIEEEPIDVYPIRLIGTADGWTVDPDYRDDLPAGIDPFGGDYSDAPADPDDEDEEEAPEWSGYLAVMDDEPIGLFDSEWEATDYCQQRRDEGRHGYPWAWSWAYYLGDARPWLIDALRSAGFVVARQIATDYYFAGIDGGGYDFESTHHAPAAAYLALRCGHTFDVGGHRVIPIGPAL